MKKILIAPDSFKESLSANRVAEIISEELKNRYKEIECYLLPLADGGEGTVDVSTKSLGTSIFTKQISGPIPELYENTEAKFAYCNQKKIAVLEMAEASGIELLKGVLEEKRNPLFTTTYGVGELILESLARGAKEILIGIGSSVTCDAGIGMLQALGAKLYTQTDELYSKIITPIDFRAIKKIDLSPVKEKLKNIKITVLCDVENPLLGSNGASKFNTQKIYSKLSIAEKDDILEKLNQNLKIALKLIKDNNLNIPDHTNPGMGAAGGLGFGLASIGGALLPGAKTIIDRSDFYNLLEKSDCVITGEGLINNSSLDGKLPITVLRLVKSKYPEKKVFFISGGNHLSTEEINLLAVDKIYSIIPNVCDNLADSLENPELYLRKLTRLIEFN